MKHKIAGRFLWKVELKKHSSTLWITTGKDCAEQATKVTRNFLSKKGEFQGHTIKSIESSGTLDA